MSRWLELSLKRWPTLKSACNVLNDLKWTLGTFSPLLSLVTIYCSVTYLGSWEHHIQWFGCWWYHSIVRRSLNFAEMHQRRKINLLAKGQIAQDQKHYLQTMIKKTICDLWKCKVYTAR
jgi:hypothetical protein